jgi:hypothetical protein
VQGLLSLLLRRQAQRGIVSGQRQGEEGGKEWHSLHQRQTILPQEPRQLAELLRRGLLPVDAERHALQQTDHRIQGGVLVVGGALTFQVRRGAAGELVAQHLDEAGFANTGLSAEHDDMPHAVARLLPALQEQGHFRFTPDKGREPTGGGDLETGVPSTLPEDTVECQPLVGAKEERLLLGLTRKIALHQRVGPGTEHDRIRHRTLLHTSGDGQRPPRHRQHVRGWVPLLLHDDLPRVDAHADRQAGPVSPLSREHQALDRLHQLQPCTHGPLGGIFIGRGIAEIDEEALTVILRNIAITVLDDALTGSVKRLDDRPEVLVVQLRQGGVLG